MQTEFRKPISTSLYPFKLLLRKDSTNSKEDNSKLKAINTTIIDQPPSKGKTVMAHLSLRITYRQKQVYVCDDVCITKCCIADLVYLRRIIHPEIWVIAFFLLQPWDFCSF